MAILKNWTTGGKAFVGILGILLLVGLYYGYKWAFPKKAKDAKITTSAKNLPPLAYDKASNAPWRELPQLDEPSDKQEVLSSPQINGLPFGWNGFSAVNMLVGGRQTSKGSIAEELGLNIKLGVNNNMTEQFNQLYAFAEDLHAGNGQPTKGAHFIILMADAWANYASGINSRLTKDFGPEFRAKIYTFAGASHGEDKWMVLPKYSKDPRGSLTATVLRDGDWNIAVIKSQLMGKEINTEDGTYDRNKVNFVAAPNDDYTEAGKMYIAGTPVTLEIVENGKHTGKDTTMTVSGVATWFPVDQQLVEKGGLVTLASTEDFPSQMACGLVFISKWADENPELMTKLIEGIGLAGDQIKSHDAALKFATQVNELVFADKERDADAWYNAFKGFEMTDDKDNTVKVGGSRAFNLADAAAYVGADGSTDTYKKIYNTFGNISREAYPEIISSVPEYTEVTDWKYLRKAYAKLKGEGKAGVVSQTDFKTADKGKVIGDANYSINFRLGSAEIDPSSYPVLDKIIAQLSIANSSFVEVTGHTDNTGVASANQTLSEARANAVRAYLLKDSDLQGRIKAKGAGQSQPLAGLDPSNGKNRRVEIKVFKAKE